MTFNKRRLPFSSAETTPFVRLHGQILSRRYERYANRREKREGKVEIRGYITPPIDCWRKEGSYRVELSSGGGTLRFYADTDGGTATGFGINVGRTNVSRFFY